MKLEVAAPGGDEAMLVATGEGEVKFVHHITLIKANEAEFSLLGVRGLGHLTTFEAIEDTTIEGTFELPNRRTGPPPTGEELFTATSAEELKSLRATGGEIGTLFLWDVGQECPVLATLQSTDSVTSIVISISRQYKLNNYD